MRTSASGCPIGPARALATTRRRLTRRPASAKTFVTSPRLVPRARCLARERALAPQEVAAVKKGPEKKAYLTLCQWQLAWNRCHLPRRAPRARACYRAARGRYMVALVATGQLTWAEVQAHRDNCLKVAVQAARARFLVALCSPRVPRRPRPRSAACTSVSCTTRKRARRAPAFVPARRLASVPARRSYGPSSCARGTQISSWGRRSCGSTRAPYSWRGMLATKKTAPPTRRRASRRAASLSTLLRRLRACRHRRPALPRERALRAALASSGALRRTGAAAPGTLGRRARSASARGATIGRGRTRGRCGRRRARRSAERRPGRARASPRRGGAPPAVRTARAQLLASARAGTGP